MKNLFINNFCFKNYSLSSSFNLNYHFLKTSRDKSFTLLSSSKTTYFSFENTTSFERIYLFYSLLMYQYINILILYYIFYLTIIFEINIFYYKGHTWISRCCKYLLFRHLTHLLFVISTAWRFSTYKNIKQKLTSSSWLFSVLLTTYIKKIPKVDECYEESIF